MTNKTTLEPSAPTPQPVVADQGNGLAIASLVLGILSVTGFFIVTGIPAIITGIMSLRKKQKERGMSIAGIIMGSIGTLLSVLFVLALIALATFGWMSSESSPTESTPSFNMDMNVPIESSRT